MDGCLIFEMPLLIFSKAPWCIARRYPIQSSLLAILFVLHRKEHLLNDDSDFPAISFAIFGSGILPNRHVLPEVISAVKVKVSIVRFTDMGMFDSTVILDWCQQPNAQQDVQQIRLQTVTSRALRILRAG